VHPLWSIVDIVSIVISNGRVSEDTIRDRCQKIVRKSLHDLIGISLDYRLCLC